MLSLSWEKMRADFDSVCDKEDAKNNLWNWSALCNADIPTGYTSIRIWRYQRRYALWQVPFSVRGSVHNCSWCLYTESLDDDDNDDEDDDDLTVSLAHRSSSLVATHHHHHHQHQQLQQQHCDGLAVRIHCRDCQQMKERTNAVHTGPFSRPVPLIIATHATSAGQTSD